MEREQNKQRIAVLEAAGVGDKEGKIAQDQAVEHEAEVRKLHEEVAEVLIDCRTLSCADDNAWNCT